MEKPALILSRMNVDFDSYLRITEESFASEVYEVATSKGAKVLKFAHNPVKFWRELRTIEYFGSQLPVPKILSVVEPETGMHGVFLMEKIQGGPISTQNLSPELAEKCGVLLARLHSLDTDKLGSFQKVGFEQAPFSSWWEYRKDLVLGAWTKPIESIVDAGFLMRTKKYLNHFYERFSESPLCFIHCDFRPGNVLSHHGEVTGLIDFESTRTGDPVYDFIKFYEFLGQKPQHWQKFLDGYASIKELPELENTLQYYEFELNYGFLQWATARSDHKLFQERLTMAKAILEKKVT